MVGESAVWPDPDPGWRVRVGAGLLVHTPMSPERRAAFDKEAEREAKAAEFEVEQRRQAVFERRWELERQGVVPHSHEDVLARVSYGLDRADKIEARREREAAEILGRPEPRVSRWELKREEQQQKAEALITPATKADVSKLSQSIASLASKVGSLGRRRAEQLETPQEYARNYGGGSNQGSSVHFRNGGGIIRGPY